MGGIARRADLAKTLAEVFGRSAGSSAVAVGGHRVLHDWSSGLGGIDLCAFPGGIRSPARPVLGIRPRAGRRRWGRGLFKCGRFDLCVGLPEETLTLRTSPQFSVRLSGFEALGWVRIPGMAGLRLDVGEAAAGRGIGNTNEMLTTRALDLPAGMAGIALQGLIAVGTVKLELVCFHDAPAYWAPNRSHWNVKN